MESSGKKLLETSKLKRIYDLLWVDYNIALSKVELEKAIILALEEWNKWEEEKWLRRYVKDEIDFAFMDLWRVWDYNIEDDLREQNEDCFGVVLGYLRRWTYWK